MKQILATVFLTALTLTTQAQLAMAEAPNSKQPQAGVPDYVGFYGLNIPGFSWSEGARVEVEYRRLTGTLDLKSTSRPQFVTVDRAPVDLSFDQASRLILTVTEGQTFDLVGLEGRATDGTGESLFFVVFVAVVDGRQINLIPSLTASKAAAPGGRPSPPGQGGPGSGPGR